MTMFSKLEYFPPRDPTVSLSWCTQNPSNEDSYVQRSAWQNYLENVVFAVRISSLWAVWGHFRRKRPCWEWQRQCHEMYMFVEGISTFDCPRMGLKIWSILWKLLPDTEHSFSPANLLFLKLVIPQWIQLKICIVGFLYLQNSLLKASEVHGL